MKDKRQQEEKLFSPKVSVLIRTYRRPELLRRAIESIERQTYSNIEIVVVEDGAYEFQPYIQQEVEKNRIKYQCIGTHVGRCLTGNRALEIASGQYCCFLDDDDYLYPDHIEVLVRKIQDCTSRMVYSWAEECEIDSEGCVKRKCVNCAYSPSRLLLCERNYLPIQSVLFERSLYDELGGFDSELTALEDWDLWLRYCTKTTIDYVPKVTSCYHTPFDRAEKQKRVQIMRDAEKMLYERKQCYVMKMTQSDIQEEVRYLQSTFNRSFLCRLKRKIFRLFHTVGK